MLIVRDARVMRDGVAVLDQLSVEVHAGEIVGVAGVEGNGQRELGDPAAVQRRPHDDAEVVTAARRQHLGLDPAGQRRVRRLLARRTA